MNVYKEVKRLAKRTIVALYWEFASAEDDFMNSIAMMNVPTSAEDDLVVALLDKEMTSRGQKVARITRTRFGGQ